MRRIPEPLVCYPLKYSDVFILREVIPSANVHRIGSFSKETRDHELQLAIFSVCRL